MDFARLKTSKGGFPEIAFTVRGHESLIQKWVNAFTEARDALTKIRTRNGEKEKTKVEIREA